MMWLRALLLCDDVRFELGGTMTLVGVHAEHIVVDPGFGEIELPRLAIYAVASGLTGVSTIEWRMTLYFETEDSGELLSESHETHDPAADEHRVVHILSPVQLPGVGRYRLVAELQSGGQSIRADHPFTIDWAAQTNERLTAQP